MTPPRRQKTTGQEPPAKPKLLVPVDQLTARLAERVALGQKLLDQPTNANDLAIFEARQSAYYAWYEYNKTLLEHSFDSSRLADEYSHIGIGWPTDRPLPQRWEWLRRDISQDIQAIASVQERLGLYEIHPDIKSSEVQSVIQSTDRKDVFIVHGHDGETKVIVARFLEKLLAQPPIILHEQADRGRTIIEKFEHHAAQAACAIVLLTADDMGGPKAGMQQPRARQNVVFELGFFVGTLGRERVVILYEPGVELPSDIQGVLFTELDGEGAWVRAIARELDAIGLSIDARALL